MENTILNTAKDQQDYIFFYKNEVYKKDRLEIPKIQENPKKVARLTHHNFKKIRSNSAW